MIFWNFWTISFTVSTVSSILMLYRQIYLIRHGKILLKESEKNYFPLVEVMQLEKSKILSAAKRGGHIAILSTIKFWVIITHISSREFKKRFPRINRFFSFRKRLGSSHLISNISSQIGEYKRKMRRFKAKLREYDSPNSSDESNKG